MKGYTSKCLSLKLSKPKVHACSVLTLINLNLLLGKQKKINIENQSFSQKNLPLDDQNLNKKCTF